MFNNWKTTIAGLATICTSLGVIFAGLKSGDTSSIGTQIPVILAGVTGLFAKDWNVTGGDTKQQL